MRNLVISVFLIISLTGKWMAQGRPQDNPSADEELPKNNNSSDLPDMEAEDSQKRFIIAEPPFRENPHRQRNYVRWGHQANRRPNLPWQTSPRDFFPTNDEETFGVRIRRSSYSSPSFSTVLPESDDNSSKNRGSLPEPYTFPNSTTSLPLSPLQFSTLPMTTLQSITYLPTIEPYPSLLAHESNIPTVGYSFQDSLTSDTEEGNSTVAPDPLNIETVIPVPPIALNSSKISFNITNPVHPTSLPQMESNITNEESSAVLAEPIFSVPTKEQSPFIPGLKNKINTGNETKVLASTNSTSAETVDFLNAVSSTIGNQSKLPPQDMLKRKLSLDSSLENSNSTPEILITSLFLSSKNLSSSHIDDPSISTDPLLHEDTKTNHEDNILSFITDKKGYRENERKPKSFIEPQSQIDDNNNYGNSTMEMDDERTPTSNRNQDPGLRLQSFPGPYPFETEVRGEGYHSRIRFDPFGGAYPASGPRPAGQTFGNWPARPPNDEIRDGATHRPLLQPFPNAGKLLSNAENARLPPFSNPDHFHHDLPSLHPSYIYTEHKNPNPSGPSTYRPPPGRPSLHPGNLGSLVEDKNTEAPNPTITDEFPVYEGHTFHDGSQPDFDYPIVANVFDDRPNPDVISGTLISVNDTADTEKDSYVDEEISTSAGSNAEDERLETTEEDLEINPSQSTIHNLGSTLAAKENQQSNGTADEPLLTDYNNDYYDLYDEFMEMYYDTDESSQSTKSKSNQTSSTTLPTTKPLRVSENTVPSTTEASKILSHQAEETTSSVIASPTGHSSLPTSTSKTETLTDSSTIESSSSTFQSTSPSTTSTSAAMTSTSTTIMTTERTASKLPLVTTTENVPEFTSMSSTVPSSSVSPSTAKVNTEDHQTEQATDDRLSSTGSIRREQTTSKQEGGSAIGDENEPLASNHERAGTNKGSSLISLSEILQGIDMSLPQFLVALKGHEMTLKDFTSSLQEKSLTQQQFTRAKGDLGSLLQMLGSDSQVTSKTEVDPPQEEHESHSDKKVSMVPYWLTSRPTWRPTTTTTTASTTETTTTTSTTTESTTTTRQPSTSAPPPKIFGFNASVSRKNSEAANNKTNENSQESTDESNKAPIPIKLDIENIMKAKGLSAADILHDLGSLFTFGDENHTGKTNLESESNSGNDGTNNTSNDDEDSSSSTQTPYTIPDTPVSLRPYRPSGGPERHRPRTYRPTENRGWGGMVNRNRNILTNRFHTTDRTTLRPPYQPPPVTQSSDISSLLNILHNSTTSSDGGSISFGLPDENEVARIPLSEDPPPKYTKGNYYPSRDDDPNSLNVSTKSAILAASILGGVAMCIFLAILVVVMYRGRARRRKPLSIPSDASSSSTPPIYSSRAGSGKGFYKTSGFWGTLKKRFDPYSLSPTPTVMT